MMAQDNLRNSPSFRRVLSIKKSVTIALLFGLLMPAAIMKFAHQDSFNYLISKEYIVTVIASIAIVFLMIFLTLFQRQRCPNCKQSWCYECKNHHILDRSVYDIQIWWVGLKLLFCSENHLQEYHCISCAYDKTERVNKKFIEFERR